MKDKTAEHPLDCQCGNHEAHVVMSDPPFGEVKRMVTFEDCSKCRAEQRQKIRQEVFEEISDYLRKRYGGVGRNASRTAVYKIAKELSIDLLIKSKGGWQQFKKEMGVK